MPYRQHVASKSSSAEAQPQDMLIVVHNFDARSADELTLRKGEHICLVELDDGFGDGWYLGRHMARGTTGLFPGVYTQKIPAWSPDLRTSSGPSIGAALPAEPDFSTAASSDPSFRGMGSPSASGQEAFPTQQAITGLPEVSPSSPKRPSSDTATLGTATESERLPTSTRTLAPSRRSLPRAMTQTIAQSNGGQDSPVMNETLSVIDEHITDLNTPRHSVMAHDSRIGNDSASDYSMNLDARQSYLPGPETDEEGEVPCEAEVNSWTAQETAAYLRQIGVDSRHCDIFQEQEISGDVLLDMDQDFIHMKDYDFGVVGRRLRTWHKIREFQEQVKGPKYRRKLPVSRPTTDFHRSRTGSAAATLPRIPSLSGQSDHVSRRSLSYGDSRNNHVPAPLQTQSIPSPGDRSIMSTGSSLSTRRASAQESPSRPSAASIREFGHSRHNSFVDLGTPSTPEARSKTASTSRKPSGHKSQSSLDQNWSMTKPTSPSRHHPDSPVTTNMRNRRSTVEGSSNRNTVGLPANDMDRGYLSGPEAESTRSRKFLRKREGPSSAHHSRQSSAIDHQLLDAAATKRHTRFGSAGSTKDIGSAVTSPASQVYHGKGFKGRFRAVTAWPPTFNAAASHSTLSPTVTNLESDNAGLLLVSPRPGSDMSGSSSPLPPSSSKFSIKPKQFGPRAVSDRVTGSERGQILSPSSVPSSSRDTPSQSPSRTGSSTPSAASRSLDLDNADTSSKDIEPVDAVAPIKVPARAKTKKDTSAYTRGLEQKSPAEQRLVCDYSGWMKKKSSSLMATWKPRLFFLRGRRLSYYYSEDDTRERGVIDISSHKVLRAEQDTMTNLHATITGASSTPITPSPPPSASTIGSSSGRGKPSPVAVPFLFKLVPPKMGLSRAVQFTKPTIHYFQVDTVDEGRKWMAAIMKATIEYDPTSRIETTNKQKTVTLAKARARKERPPALRGDENEAWVSSGPKSDDTGLNIRGLSFDDVLSSDKHVNGTTIKDKHPQGFQADQPDSKNRSVSEVDPNCDGNHPPT